jgi:hypothetical protein
LSWRKPLKLHTLSEHDRLIFIPEASISFNLRVAINKVQIENLMEILSALKRVSPLSGTREIFSNERVVTPEKEACAIFNVADDRSFILTTALPIPHSKKVLRKMKKKITGIAIDNAAIVKVFFILFFIIKFAPI